MLHTVGAFDTVTPQGRSFVHPPPKETGWVWLMDLTMVPPLGRCPSIQVCLTPGLGAFHCPLTAMSAQKFTERC